MKRQRKKAHKRNNDNAHDEYDRIMQNKPLCSYKHPKRTVYINEVEKIAWMKSMDVYYVPNQIKRKNIKYRKDEITMDKINTVTAIDNDRIPPPPKPLTYKQQVLIDTYSPTKTKKDKKKKKKKRQDPPIPQTPLSPLLQWYESTKNEIVDYDTNINLDDNVSAYVSEENSEVLNLYNNYYNDNTVSPFLNGLLFHDFAGNKPKNIIDLIGLQNEFSPKVVRILSGCHRKVVTKLCIPSLLETRSSNMMVEKAIKKKCLIEMFKNKSCSWIKLSHLNISKTDVVDNELLMSIGQSCPCLQYIDVSFNANIDDVGLKNLAKKRPGVKSWVLNNCTNVSNLGVKFIVDICKNHLKALELGGTESKIDDGGILYVSKHAHSLELINCSGNTRVTDISLADITKDSKLQQIFFSRNVSIDGSLCNYICSLQKLVSLDLSYCPSLDDSHIYQLAANRGLCKTFVNLKFVSCKLITDDSMCKLVKYSKSLKEIDLSHLRKKRGDVPLTPIVELRTLAVTEEQNEMLYRELIDGGFKLFEDGLDFGDFIFGIDQHLLKTRDFVDVDTGLNLWVIFTNAF